MGRAAGSAVGVLAVVVTRPVPLLAETVAVMAGAERLGPVPSAVASAAGVLPGAVLYAVAGALGWSTGTGPIVSTSCCSRGPALGVRTHPIGSERRSAMTDLRAPLAPDDPVPGAFRRDRASPGGASVPQLP